MCFWWERNELMKSHRVKLNSVFALKKKGQMTSWCIWKCKVASLGFRFSNPGCYQNAPSVPSFAALYWQNSSCRCLEGCFQILLVGEINFVKASMNFAVTHGTEQEKCFPLYDGGSRYHVKQWFDLWRCPSALEWLRSILALLALLIPTFFALQLCVEIFCSSRLYLLVRLKLLFNHLW